MRYELRIGNITEQGVVDAIHPDRAEVIKDKARDFLLYDALKPIPLTEEWLMKFGFEHEGQAIGRLRLDCEFGEVMIWLNGKNPNCKYVHQLQNLYFALTGEELELKSPG